MNNIGGGLYFAYGSNINLEQMKRRCPNARPLMPVVLQGYELRFRGHGGVATIIPKESAKIHGLLWDITPECEKALDQYEGIPHLYTKESVVVVNEKDHSSYRVMVYVMTPEYAKIPQEPALFYFQGILQGYHQNKLPRQALFNALHATREDVAAALHAESVKDFEQFRFKWYNGKSKSNAGKPRPKGKGR